MCAISCYHMTVNYRGKICHDDWYDRYWHLTLVIAFARAIPGSPVSFFVFRPRTSYFWRLTWTSKGFSAFFFWESALTTFSDRRFRFALFLILPIIYNKLNATDTSRTHVRTHTNKAYESQITDHVRTIPQGHTVTDYTWSITDRSCLTVYLSEAVISHLWITHRVELHKRSLLN